MLYTFLFYCTLVSIATDCYNSAVTILHIGINTPVWFQVGYENLVAITTQQQQTDNL